MIPWLIPSPSESICVTDSYSYIGDTVKKVSRNMTRIFDEHDL